MHADFIHGFHDLLHAAPCVEQRVLREPYRFIAAEILHVRTAHRRIIDIDLAAGCPRPDPGKVNLRLQKQRLLVAAARIAETGGDAFGLQRLHESLPR